MAETSPSRLRWRQRDPYPPSARTVPAEPHLPRVHRYVTSLRAADAIPTTHTRRLFRCADDTANPTYPWNSIACAGSKAGLVCGAQEGTWQFSFPADITSVYVHTFGSD